MVKDKSKKLKVPKRIAGVKVPKKVRRPINKALAFADNPAARDLAIAALTAAAGALAARGTEGDQRRRRPGEPGTDDRAGQLADTVIAAALDGARRLLDGLGAAAAPDEAEEENSPPPAPASPKPRRGRASARSAPSGSAAGE